MDDSWTYDTEDENVPAPKKPIEETEIGKNGEDAGTLGKKLENTGTALKVGSAGAEMSGTGIGALIGVPTAPVGGAVAGAAGKGVNKAGQVATKIGKQGSTLGGNMRSAGKDLGNLAQRDPMGGKSLLQRGIDLNKRRASKRALKNQDKIITTFGLFSSIVLVTICVVVDIVQIILDFFIVGVIGNRIIDVVTGGLFVGLLLIKRITFSEHTRIYLSVGSVFLLEEIPILDAAPFWTLDAIYTIMRLRASDNAHNEGVRARQQAQEEQQQIQSVEAQYSYQDLQQRRQYEQDTEDDAETERRRELKEKQLLEQKYSYDQLAEMQAEQYGATQPLSYNDLKKKK